MGLWFGYDARYQPVMAYSKAQVNGWWGTTFKNFFTVGLDFVVQPWGYHDYFEPRVEGVYWDKPTWSRVGGWFSSDYRKPFALDGGFSYRSFAGSGVWSGSKVIGFSIKPIIRFSDRFNMKLDNNTTFRIKSMGFVNFDAENNIIFGSRYRQDMINQITMTYLFGPRMSLSLRIRHYWAILEYKSFYQLDETNGSLGATPYEANHDANYNAFNLDLIFRWRFAPGSELNVVWKNSVLSIGDEIERNYFKNFGDMFADGQANQFSVKALYFLDFSRFQKKKHGKRLDS